MEYLGDIEKEKTDKLTDKLADKLIDKKIKKQPKRDEILDFCKEPKTLKEITKHFGFKDIATFKKHYINPLLKEETLQMTIPDKPKSRNQKYVSTR